MPDLKPDAIELSDIQDYLSDYSDFSFELSVLKKLNDLGLDCEHSGTYEDPITKKSREFDIRAHYVLGENKLSVHLSVECKNIKDNFPLVLHCLKRTEVESYNEFIHTFNSERLYESLDHLHYNDRTDVVSTFPYSLEQSSSILVDGEFTLYPQGEYVAKSTDQVGRKKGTENSIVSNDGGVFEKISQAINSANDLILETHELNTDETDFLTFICPVLVVPDGRLWQIKYTDDGDIDGIPEKIDHMSYYIGKKWTVGMLPGLTYTLSHLEIITFSHLHSFINDYLGSYIQKIEPKITDIIAES